MSTLSYQHALSGKSVGAGLPLRRASRLYDVEPNIVYPNAFSTGTFSDQHAYNKGVFLRVPHLPITRVIEPYVNNHKAGGGNFTRHQYFVIKRGQPVMARTKREPTIGLFNSDGVIERRTYADPKEMEGANVRLVGFSDESADQWYRLDDASVTDSDAVIDKAAYDALPASDTDTDATTADQTDYSVIDMTAGDKLTVDEYDGLTEAQQADFREVYEGLEDKNDKIATGGHDLSAEYEEALDGDTNLVKYLQIDANSFFFGAATKAQGFIYPATGGFTRVAYFDEVDVDAEVTLPVDGSDTPRLVAPVGQSGAFTQSGVDVTADNQSSFANSAVILDPSPTIGFAHTDLEQATSHKYHQFQTGTDVHSPMRKGTHLIPFVDVVKLKAIIAERAPEVSFDFTDLANGKSGLKVGVDLADGAAAAKVQSVQNRYSLLTAADSGYGNLNANFGAPFLTLTEAPAYRDEIVSDLFGNFVKFGSGYFADAADVADTEAEFGTGFGLTSAELADNVDGAMVANARHKTGEIVNIFDMPAQSMIKHVVNNQFQMRQHSDWATEGYKRVRSEDNAGLEPILGDFALMILGGSSYEWSSGILPKWDKRRQTVANIIEDLVVQHAVGMVEIASSVVR